MPAPRLTLALRTNRLKLRLRPRTVIVGLGLFLATLLSFVVWLLGDYGVHQPKTVQTVIATSLPIEPRIVPIPNAEDLPLEPRLSPLTGTENILIAGMDRRPGAKGSGLTDTLIVVAMERKTGQVGLISIPRDIAIEVPQHGLDRINTVYSMAQSHGENGLAALKQAVGDLLALPIQHAILVDLGVFEQLIDNLGGVSVNVPCPIIDDFVDPRTPVGRRVLDVKAGEQRMSGVTAAMYVRSRHGRSDFSRARRQQAVLNAIHRELLSLGNLNHLPEVLTTVESHVSTDLKRYQLLDLARRAIGMRVELVHAIVLSENECEPLLDRGRAMLAPRLDAIDLAISKLFTAPAPGIEHRVAACLPADVALRHKERSVPGEKADPEPQTSEPGEAVKVVSNSGGLSTKL